MAAIRRGKVCKWTVPSSARPGDWVVIYKPGASSGWGEDTKPAFESFVAAGVVYGIPERIEKGFFNAPISVLKVFPNPSNLIYCVFLIAWRSRRLVPSQNKCASG